ncbi:cAMP-dependent protein kinase inhibitor gamma [Python bivittatus]|uniref:cAMP-dependent protein kinase inhibitor gamma n=1 Tax=Python bivittatus TaxID=176946 RepID=A0A9F5MTI8_PYTBI|nr:cAMP-dependent protein kinase inhibitor gamma [Python bivittatus]
MSENRKGTFLRQCQKCHVNMNGDMLDAQGVCLHCKDEAREEHPKNQKSRRDSVTYNVSEMMETEPAYSDFISCDRAGRRNAIHDLQGDAAALKLEKLANTMDISIAEEGELFSFFAENQGKEAANEKDPGMIPERKNDSSTF